eukprot:341067-Amphidinium_carterae.4
MRRILKEMESLSPCNLEGDGAYPLTVLKEETFEGDGELIPLQFKEMEPFSPCNTHKRRWNPYPPCNIE